MMKTNSKIGVPESPVSLFLRETAKEGLGVWEGSRKRNARYTREEMGRSGELSILGVRCVHLLHRCKGGRTKGREEGGDRSLEGYENNVERN